MMASWRGHLNTVKVLLRATAKTDAQDQVCEYSKPLIMIEHRKRGRKL